MILLVDNYDSFVYNLARYFEELGQPTRVCRNDALRVSQVQRLRPRAIVLSPGPGTPAQAGISVELVRRLDQHIPILGVCLGHQCIAEALGGRVVRAPEPVHGRVSRILHNGRGLFHALPLPLAVGRYHSLVVDAEPLPDPLEVTATTQDGLIMGLEHRYRPLAGVQFHPESILSSHGHRLLDNFLSTYAAGDAGRHSGRPSMQPSA